MGALPWVLGCIALGAVGLVRAEEPKTADEVIGKYIAAIGGRAKLDARQSMRLSGKVTMTGGIEARFTHEFKRPNKLRMEAAFQGATSLQVYDGRSAWMRTPFGDQAGATDVPADLARYYAEPADLDGPLVDYAKKGHQVELVGREDVDGRPAYKLKLIRKDAREGDVEYHYLDAKSFLPIKIAGKRTIEGMKTEYQTAFGDYKAVDGLLIAHSIRQQSDSTGMADTIVEKVELNVDLPDERFARPAGRPPETEPAATSAPVIENDPPARALYDQMVAALRAPNTLYVECQHQWSARGMQLGRCTYKLWLKKPNYFRMETTIFTGAPGGVLIGDGDNLWIYWPGGRPMFSSEDAAAHNQSRDKVYYNKPTPPAHHSISHEAGLLGAGIAMTIVDPSTFHGYTDGLQPLLSAVGGRGTERVGEEDCDVIEVSFMDGQRTWQLWLSQRDHLPRKLKEVVRVAYDIIKEETWSTVTINGEIPADRFVWKPPEDWKQWWLPETEQQMLKPGTAAPEFEAALADGKRLKLAELRGKVVLLVFWRVG